MNIEERNEIVRQYLPMVWKQVNHFLYKHKALTRFTTGHDLFQEGVRALIRSTELYNPSHLAKASFLTYAYMAVHSHLIRISRTERLIPIPDDQYYRMCGRLPANRHTERARQVVASRIKSMGPLKYGDRECFAVNQERSSDQLVALDVGLKRLSIADREILGRKFGLNGRIPETIQQIADSIGITHQGVEQRVATARKHLKKEMERMACRNH